MTLYLLPHEQDLYEKLPKELQKFSVVEETGDSWETDEQLMERLKYVHDEMDTKTKLAFQKLYQKIQEKGVDAISDKDVPNDTFGYVFYVFGAIGLTGLIDAALTNTKDSEDVEAVKILSRVRHRLLIANKKLLPTEL